MDVQAVCPAKPQDLTVVVHVVSTSLGYIPLSFYLACWLCYIQWRLFNFLFHKRNPVLRVVRETQTHGKGVCERSMLTTAHF